MGNSYFQFKQFVVNQEHCAMKVSTEACILGAWTSYNSANRILDIGSGTGLLSLMLAQKYDCVIDAVELEKGAAQQSVQNFRISTWNERLNVIHNNIQNFAEKSINTYDLIVSNPPFFTNSLKSEKTSENQAKHDDGLPKSMLIDSIKKLLSKKGIAYVLLPERESEDLKQHAKSVDLDCMDSLIIKNRIGVKVFRKIVALGNTSNVETKELVIRNQSNEYTEDFQNLLRPYYLKL